MIYAQYLRIETKAGGSACTPRQFITAAHTLLTPEARTRQHRVGRHIWLRQGLQYLKDARRLHNYLNNPKGDIA